MSNYFILNLFYNLIMKNNCGIISNLQSNFTTTNSITLTTSQLAIMSSMKQYFIYKVFMYECGISSITLEGSLEDWEKLKKNLNFYQKKNLD